MPALKDLACSIELADNQQALQEFNTIYNDGSVEAFVGIPSRPLPFTIHLTSNKRIASGLSIFVYIDGIYQCNRNKQNLNEQKLSTYLPLIDFRVRQKEERQSDGTMIAYQWGFDKLDRNLADTMPNMCISKTPDNIGCIEVVVLRCARSARSKKPTTINLDGANDPVDHYFGLDGQPRTHRGISNFKEVASSAEESYIDCSPPPSLPCYRHTRPRSKYSEPLSPRQTPPAASIPRSSYQYGNGPIPATTQSFFPPVLPPVAPHHMGTNPAYLQTLVREAVKQGLEESPRNDRLNESKLEKPEADASAPSYHLPGAWPSPTNVASQVKWQSESMKNIEIEAQNRTNPDCTKKQIECEKTSGITRGENQIWATDLNTNGWPSAIDAPEESWDTDDSWTKDEPSDSDMLRQTNGLEELATKAQSRDRSTSPVHYRSEQWLVPNDRKQANTSSKSHSGKSVSVRRGAFSSDDDDGSWVYLRAAPVSSSQPIISKPQVVKTPPSVSSTRSLKSNSRKATTYCEEIFTAAPPPSWGCAASSKARKISIASMPPTPYATSFHSFVQSTKYTSTPVAKVEDSVGVSSALGSSWGSEPKLDDSYKIMERDAQSRAAWNKIDDSNQKNLTAHEAGYEVGVNPWAPSWTPATIKEQHDGSNDGWSTGAIQHTDETVPSDFFKNVSNKAKTATIKRGSHTNSKKSSTANVKGDVQWHTENMWATKADPNEQTIWTSNTRHHHRRPGAKQDRLYSYRVTHFNPSGRQSPYRPPTRQLNPTVETGDIGPRKTSRDISQVLTRNNRPEQQNRDGKGVRYGHAIRRPEYIDSISDPYAVFRFKYRSRSHLENLFGPLIPAHGPLTVPTPTSTISKEKEKLNSLPQEELVDKMLRLQSKLSRQEQADGPSARYMPQRDNDKDKAGSEARESEKIAREFTASWVVNQADRRYEEAKKPKRSERLKEERTKAERRDGAGGEGCWDTVS